jgi:hypothetical protein
VLTWTEAHLSTQLKNIKWKNRKKEVIPNLYPPVGHPYRRHPAAGHRPVPSSPSRALPSSPPHALSAPPRTRRAMVAAPHPHLAARSSSPHAAPILPPGACRRPELVVGRPGMGQGRRSARDGAGGGDLLEMEKGRRSARDGAREG